MFALYHDQQGCTKQGNADIAEVKGRHDGKLLSLGNIEFLAIETLQPEEIETLARRAIEAGLRYGAM